jgi:general secretion pathway protein J
VKSFPVNQYQKNIILKKDAFTLLEILIAITIFSVLVTTIYSSLNAVLSRNDAIVYGADIHEKARSCLNRIVMDLNSVYVELPPLYKQPETISQPDKYRFVAEKTTVGTNYYAKVRFTSMAHLPMTGNPATGIGEIIYYAMENEDRDASPVLRRSDRAYPFFQEDDFEEKESDPIICEDLEELVFTFYDQDGEAHEEWDSESDFYKYATPKMIGIQLKIKKKSETYVFNTQVELPVYREKPK